MTRNATPLIVMYHGNMSRFFTSPDYNFRLKQGGQAIDRSAAARGGALSGNALRAGTEYASNLAAGEYNNYVARLMQMAGMGTQATNSAVQSGQNAANNIGNSYLNQGDARASGIAGQYGAINGLIQGLGGLYGSYMGSRSPYSGLDPYDSYSTMDY